MFGLGPAVNVFCLAELLGPLRANRDQDRIGQDGTDQVVRAADPRVVCVDVGRDEPCAICWPQQVRRWQLVVC